MTDEPDDDDGSSPLPILIAIGVVAVILLTSVILRSCQSDRFNDAAGVGRAVVGQNDALQRENYADFRTYTCAAEQGSEAEVLGAQRQSTGTKGARYVDDVGGLAVTGDRATATVVYHFEKVPDDKVTTTVNLVRENGDWRVCSPGPR